jgi:hypothetical protein
MSIFEYTILRDGQTSMSRSSSMRCKDVSTKTTGKSAANTSDGASTPKIQEQKLKSSRVTIQTTDELPEEAALWRAVIAQAIRDLYDCTVSAPRLRREVLTWITTPDFEVVCLNASVPAYDLREQIASLSTLPPSLAKKYGQLLRRKISEID